MLPNERTKKSCFDESSLKILNNKNKEYPVFNGILKENNCMVNGSNCINSLSNSSSSNVSSKEDLKIHGWRFTKKDIIWRNVVAITLFHLMSLYAYLTFPYFQRIKTLLWGKFLLHKILIQDYINKKLL
jgi:hypothetical protein